MIDYGLLLSVLLAFAVPSLAMRWWPLTTYSEPMSFLDLALWPAALGILVGRSATLILDDPSSMWSLADFVIVRSGVEFWPGVIAAGASVAWTASRSRVAPVVRLADVAALATLGYAAYEAACVFRDGCFGPLSPVGLQPPGVSSTMLPVGWLMAAALGGIAIGLHKLAARNAPNAAVVIVAVLGVASVRSVASFWLPHVGSGPTRQHLMSLTVVGASAGLLSATLLRPPRASPPGVSRHHVRSRVRVALDTRPSSVLRGQSARRESRADATWPETRSKLLTAPWKVIRHFVVWRPWTTPTSEQDRIMATITNPC